MRHLSLAAVLVPALLGSTAVVAQDNTPHFALGATGGITALNLPSGQNGVLWGGGANVSGTTGQLLLGETASFSVALGLGKVGQYDGFVGLTGFGTFANGGSSSTQNFSGLGYVVIPGLSTPDNGAITLTTSRAPGSASAGVTVTATDPQSHVYNSSSSATSGAGQSDAFVSTAGNSFIMGGTNAQAAGGSSSSLAYGAIADTSGSIFIATGNLDGLAISTSTHNSILYAGADLTFGASGTPDDRTSIQAYVGPSYRNIGQWNSTSTSLTVDVPEVPSTITHPLYILNRNGTVSSNYFGAVVGGTISHQVSDAVSVSFGGEASLYYVNARLKGNETVRTTGGVGLGGGSPDVTVVEDGVSASQSMLAYAIRAQTSATVALSPSMSLTGTLNADYLSAVARPNGGANVSYSNGNASWTSGGPLLSFDGMFAFGGAISLTGTF